MAVEYANAHYVFRILGHFGSSGTTKTENWSTGFRIGTVGADAPVLVSGGTFLESVASVIRTFHTDPASCTGNTCWVDELTIARVGTDGKYLPATQATVRRLEVPPYSGVNSPIMPWNTSMVISQRTNIPRGIASNGRTYWPVLRLQVDTATGRVSQGALDAYVAVAKTLVTGINTKAAADLAPSARVIVAGQTGKTGAARAAAVTQIRCDGRLDSIERRENEQAIAYSTAVI